MIGGTGTDRTRCPRRPAARPDCPGAGTALHRQSVLELAPLPSAVSCARLHAVHVLHEWGLRALAGDTAMIVSELMTNAADASVVLRDRPPVTLRLLATEASVLIEVWDHSPEDPKPREVDAEDEGGRGLAVVAALSTRWGFERVGYWRKVVRAELALLSAVSCPAPTRPDSRNPP